MQGHFLSPRALNHLSKFPPFPRSRQFVERMQQTDACASERDRESPGQATGGFRSMHPYARLPARVRRPASSSDVILPYLAIPGYPSAHRRHQYNNGSRPDQIFVLRKLDWNLFSFMSMELFLKTDINSRFLYLRLS